MKYGELNLGQIEALVNKLGGMTAVEGILRGGDMSEAVASLITPTNPVYRVTVDRDKKFKAMIEAGQYVWVNSDITEKNFKVEGSGTVEVDIELIHYNRSMSTDDVLKDLDRRGFRPATIDELLALGADPKTRDLQRQFPIVALGSVWRRLSGNRNVAFLDGNASKRHLPLYWVGDDWHGFYRFAAVRK